MVRKISSDIGKLWKKESNSVLTNGLVGAASPSILKISNQKRFLYYFRQRRDAGRTLRLTWKTKTP
ncbi:MAG: hypothetical protein CML56_07125 [Rhodobacteraceae bacterium]|nr:hypothetical protein [Paracoccaceae bacterium]